MRRTGGEKFLRLYFNLPLLYKYEITMEDRGQLLIRIPRVFSFKKRFTVLILQLILVF